MLVASRRWPTPVTIPIIEPVLVLMGNSGISLRPIGSVLDLYCWPMLGGASQAPIAGQCPVQSRAQRLLPLSLCAHSPAASAPRQSNGTLVVMHCTEIYCATDSALYNNSQNYSKHCANFTVPHNTVLKSKLSTEYSAVECEQRTRGVH